MPGHTKEDEAQIYTQTNIHMHVAHSLTFINIYKETEP